MFTAQGAGGSRGGARGSGGPVASVAELWRYPVKSMAGERIEETRLGGSGLHGDRLWAVRDLEEGMTGTGRRLAGLMACSARYVDEPGADAGPGNSPEVVITFPDGSERSSADPAIDEALCELLGRRVRLTALPPRGENREHRAPRWTAADIRRDLGIERGERMPDASYLSLRQALSLARWATPPGAYVDFFPLHVLSRASLEAMAELAPDSDFDVRRFRPNVLIETEATGTPEREWCGARIEAARSAFRIEVPTVRCVVPTRAQPGLGRDPQVMRTVAAHADRHLGVYATVTREGRLAVGEPLTLKEDRHGPLRRALDRSRTAVRRQAMRGVEKVMG